MSRTLRPVTSGITSWEVSWTLIPFVTTPLPRSIVWYHPIASACSWSSWGVVTGGQRSGGDGATSVAERHRAGSVRADGASGSPAGDPPPSGVASWPGCSVGRHQERPAWRVGNRSGTRRPGGSRPARPGARRAGSRFDLRHDGHVERDGGARRAPSQLGGPRRVLRGRRRSPVDLHT